LYCRKYEMQKTAVYPCTLWRTKISMTGKNRAGK
jgi:hypothetical protein